MAGTQKIGKKLPKRVGNVRLKERRAASWKRGQERKEQRRKTADERHAQNLQRVADQIPTPWERAKKWEPGTQARRRLEAKQARAERHIARR